MRIEPVNENSLIIYFAEHVSIETADKIAAVSGMLSRELEGVLVDIIPSYTSILLSCDLVRIGLKAFELRVNELIAQFDSVEQKNQETATLVLPVYYGEEVALDHQVISDYTNLSFAEVIERHTAQTYRVFALGFAPGFAYLGNVDEAIAMPRKSSPRLRVPKGSVGIADRQTAIYPQASPGGWQVIGRTPLEIFDVSEKSLSRFEMGAKVRFESISRERFISLGGQLGS